MPISCTVRFALAILSISLGAALWDYVNLPYRNPQNVIGILSQREFNPTTNLVRFALFVVFPSLTWILLGRLLKARNVTYPLDTSRREDPSTWSFHALAVITGVGLLVALGSSLGRLNSNLAWFYLDLFHDGDLLAPAFNWSTRGTLWTGNFITRGAFHDVFSPWLGWQLFGRQTIGAFKAFQYVLDAAVPIGLWLFVLCLQYSLRGIATRLERAILVASSFSLLYWAQRKSYVWFQPRGLSVFLCLGTLALAFNTKRRVWFFAAGTLTVFALFTSSDAGIYSIATSVLAIGLFAWGPRIRENFKHEVLPWGVGFVCGHLAVLLAFGQTEYLAWMSQIVATATRWDFVYSYIYPSPLLTSSWANHAWPMALLSLLLLGFTVMLPAYRFSPNTRTLGQIHLVVVGISLFAYRTALGRSDLSHIAQGLAFTCFGLAFSLWLLARWTSLKVQWNLLAIAFFPLLWAIVSLTADGAWSRAATVYTRLQSYANTPDSTFLTDQQRNAQSEFTTIFKDEQCSFVFPNEPAWYYLLQKPTCGRFFFTVHVMGKDYQEELSCTLAKAAPRYILYSSPIPTQEVDGFPNSTRLPRLDAWIKEQYAPFKSVEGWLVYRWRAADVLRGASRLHHCPAEERQG